MPLISRNKCLDILNEPLIYIKNGRDCLIPESNLHLYYGWVENREPRLPEDMEVGAVFDPVDIEGYVVKYKHRRGDEFFTIAIDWTVQSELQYGYMSINQFREWDLSWLDYVTIDLLQQEISLHDWRFAKTMPKNPHWYVVRKNWASTQLSFDDFVMTIREKGRDIIFKGWRYRVYDIGDYYYWSMGEPVSKTIIINRTTGS